LARETLSEQQVARTALEVMIAAPETLQYSRGILRTLADQDLTLHAQVINGTGRQTTAATAGSPAFWAALALAVILARNGRKR
ncbi:hypothetical protein ACH4PU_35740, partial [Streptomyces sp. NPDC021100]